MFKFLIAGAALALIASPVSAQRITGRDVVSSSPTALYCAENVPIEGTPYVKRVCRTRADWIKSTGIDPVAVVLKRHKI